MSANAKSDARLNFRLSSESKRTIEQAAGQLGQSVSEFAVSTLVRTAHDVMARHDRTELSNRDRDVFLAMLDAADAAPNEALARAAEKYKKEIDSSAMAEWDIQPLSKPHDRSAFDCGNATLNEWSRKRAGQ